jgi:hypothetical protein
MGRVCCVGDVSGTKQEDRYEMPGGTIVLVLERAEQAPPLQNKRAGEHDSDGRVSETATAG